MKKVGSNFYEEVRDDDMEIDKIKSSSEAAFTVSMAVFITIMAILCMMMISVFF